MGKAAKLVLLRLQTWLAIRRFAFSELRVPGYRQGVIGAAAGLTLAVVGFAVPIATATVAEKIAAAAAVVGAASAAWALLRALAVIAEARPSRPGWRFARAPAPQSPRFERRPGEPSSNETDLPDRPYADWRLQAVRRSPGRSTWIYRSAALDQALASGAPLPMTIDADPATWRAARRRYPVVWSQAVALLNALAQSRPLINEGKVGIADLGAPGAVAVSRTSYFFSCITNEACHTALHETPQASAPRSAWQARFEFSSLLSPFVPRPGGLAFDRARYRLMSNHAGITTVAVTSDAHLLIYRQKDHNQQAVGELICAGSGSLNWSDLLRAGGGDLAPVLRAGMARELCEEATWAGRGLRPVAEADRIAARTRLTGAFLWPARGAKPEFVGVTRLDLPIGAVQPDEFEVGADPGVLLMLDRPSLQAFRDLADRLKPDDGFSVSTAAALHRLADLGDALDRPGHPEAAAAAALQAWLFGADADSADRGAEHPGLRATNPT